jgi:IS605 OrfB family transposase
VRGLKLIFRGDRPYLYFTVDLQDPDLPVGITWDSEQKKRRLPDDLLTVAIDLGQRHTACATLVRRADGCFPDAPEQTHFIRTPGAELATVAAHQRDLGSRIRRLTAGPQGRARHLARGLPSFLALREHLSGSKSHRYKKAAHEIVSFTARHGARVIIIEKLKGYRPDVENPRVVNRGLMNWNRRLIVEFTKQLARPAGISVRHVPAQWSSRFCSRCGQPGARFAIATRAEAESAWGRKKGLVAGRPVVRRGGPLFCCASPDCGRMVNADFNASMNLQRRFHGAWARSEPPPDWREVEGHVQDSLNLRFAPPDTWDAAVAARRRIPPSNP